MEAFDDLMFDLDQKAGPTFVIEEHDAASTFLVEDARERNAWLEDAVNAIVKSVEADKKADKEEDEAGGEEEDEEEEEEDEEEKEAAYRASLQARTLVGEF